MLNILIAHEQTLIRSGVKYILHSSPQISHIGEASTGLDVVRKLRTKNWHLLLLNVALVSGHLHIRTTDYRDGVRFEEVSLGYPRNWDQVRGIEGYLRQILPTPAKKTSNE